MQAPSTHDHASGSPERPQDALPTQRIALSPDLDAAHARIQARIRAFDASALLDLLSHLGYEPGDIAFRAYESSAPQPSLFHAIEFHDHAPRVTVTVNVGLASCRSPLPSYVAGLLADMDVGEPLRELLDLLDHALIRGRLLGERPERVLGEDWAAARRDMLGLSGLSSPSGIDWLFRHAFPELDVVVRRGATAHAMPAAGVRIGHARLGGCAFGARSLVPVRDVHVTLRCKESLSPAGAPWLHEAQARLGEIVFPILQNTRVHLTVALLLLDASMVAELDAGSPVGYAPLRGGEDVPRYIEIFRGQVPGQVVAAQR